MPSDDSVRGPADAPREGAEGTVTSEGAVHLARGPRGSAVPRRRSVLGSLAVALGAGMAAVYAVPVARFLGEPLARRDAAGGGSGRWRRVARLADLSSEIPVAVAVIGPRVDAWTRTPAERLGTVFLRKKGERDVLALQAECPHLGCSVRIDAARRRFACPCHESHFDFEGRQISGPSPRDLDPLAARVTADGHVEVEFVRFRTQTSERVRMG
jgi:Rieske Fe-S protein